MRKYAVIYSNRLTQEHIELIRITGINSYDFSLARTPDSWNATNDEMVIVEWDHDIAQQIPEAMAAIQQMIDEGVTIRSEAEMQAYLIDTSNPFYEPPV